MANEEQYEGIFARINRKKQELAERKAQQEAEKARQAEENRLRMEAIANDAKQRLEEQHRKNSKNGFTKRDVSSLENGKELEAMVQERLADANKSDFVELPRFPYISGSKAVSMPALINWHL